MQISSRILRLPGDTRQLLVKWGVALLVPILVFTFVWSGEGIVNNVILGILSPGSTDYDTPSLIQAAIFILILYATVLALCGYLVAADSGRRKTLSLWLDILVFVLVPLLLVITNGLILGMAFTALVWVLFFVVRNRVFHAKPSSTPTSVESLMLSDAEQKSVLMSRAIAAGFWFATAFAVISLVVDLIFFFMGQLPTVLLIWVVVRTLLLPVAGYFLGRLGGLVALRRVISNQQNGNSEEVGDVDKEKQLEVLSSTRLAEEATDIVPNDLPLRSRGAQRFYLIILVAFVLFYPVLDPFLFGSGTAGRLSGYGDAGYYVILALGLNIVVGFAGLLDLGYVAFFAIGSYVWGIFGSNQFNILTGIAINPQVLSALFWPMVIVTALIAALFGVLLGAPTLRLRGDYLAIVTLGFGEIVPIVFLELDRYTNGANGIVGVHSPSFPGVEWSTFTPVPFYYLILLLIALVIFANIRLRDSRLGRAWVAIREDEIAAASSGVNLVQTKLFAFASGAFFAGVAGAYHAAKLGGVSPDLFSFGDSVIYLAMVVIGGIGSIPGVIVGALVVYSINEFILAQLDTLAADPSSIIHPIYNAIVQVIPGFTFGNIRNLVFGVVLVCMMIFRPEGLIPSARRRRELHHVTTGAEMGSLDPPSGSSDMEAEMHVE
ncbi:MAG: branched-chain amino acid ABC transporter permease [Chloroflexota bacterium]|nr:branched-chain amino acid ABC transporter permease [Chloroflexota bacterium]